LLLQYFSFAKASIIKLFFFIFGKAPRTFTPIYRVEVYMQVNKKIINLDIQKITIGRAKSKKEIEIIAQSFKQLQNIYDNRVAEIPLNTIGKIYGHKGYDISQIFEYIPILFEKALLGWSEPELQQEGKKAHPNIKEYHHYINKFDDGAGEYYIRFILHEEKAKPKKIGKNYLHSIAISEMAIYGKSDHPNRIRVIDPCEVNPPLFYDLRLADFLLSVKVVE